MDKKYSWDQKCQLNYISICSLFLSDMPGPSLSLSALLLMFGFWQISRSPWCTKPGRTQSSCDHLASLAWKETYCTNTTWKGGMNLNSTRLLRSLCTAFKASTKDNEVEKTLDLEEAQGWLWLTNFSSQTWLSSGPPEPPDIALLGIILTHPALWSFSWWCKVLSGVVKIHPLWMKGKKMVLISRVLLLN